MQIPNSKTSIRPSHRFVNGGNFATSIAIFSQQDVPPHSVLTPGRLARKASAPAL
jgi:hypothetical protein